MKRKAELRITTAEQLKLIRSPTAIDIVQALRQRGPATVSELGQRIGKRPNSCHYHVAKLVKAGFVQAVDTRRSGARTETIYDVVANQFVGPNAPKSPALRQTTREAVAGLLRLAARQFSRATECPEQLCEEGPKRNILVTRHAARLTSSQLAAVNRHFRAVEKIFLENSGSSSGQLCAATLVLTPLPETKGST